MRRVRVVTKPRFWPFSVFAQKLSKSSSLGIFTIFRKINSRGLEALKTSPYAPNRRLGTFGALKFFLKNRFFEGITTRFFELDVPPAGAKVPGDKNTFSKILKTKPQTHVLRPKIGFWIGFRHSQSL